MDYRKLGRTGYDLSTLGFGTWQLGGGRWQSLPEDESVTLLQSAAQLGVNIYDAAAVYGQYQDATGRLTSRSLELLGKAFGSGSLRESTAICLKLGQFDEVAHYADYTPRRVVGQLQYALKLLQREVIDICLIHAPSLHEVMDGRALAVVQTIKALGLAKAVGYSFENEPEHAALAIQQGVDVIMLQYNLLDSQCASVLDEVWDSGVGVLVGGPFKRGYLSGQYRQLSDFPRTDDYWNRNVTINPGKVSSILDRTNALLDQAGSPAALRRKALAHILAKPAVASVIVGHRKLEEVSDNVAAINLLEKA